MGSFKIHSDFALGCGLGAIFILLVAAAGALTITRGSTSYSLGHWVLNLDTPFKSLWQNVGYWKTAEGEPIDKFHEACSALLREVTGASGILKKRSTPDESRRFIAILDLGFGCGDQTWELARRIKAAGWLGFQYVGLTLDDAQVQAAYRKVHREIVASAAGDIELESFQLFCANAAKPESWSRRISEAVESLADDKFTERWLLALDCIYYFSPSRKPILRYAAGRLNANFMAFDLLLNDTASRWDIWIARAIGVFMGCPLRTFVREDEYRKQLVDCGYDGDAVIIREITDDVFPGLVRFLDSQDRALGEYGISLSGFKLSQRLFDWFRRSRVVRAVIVVARTKGEVDSST